MARAIKLYMFEWLVDIVVWVTTMFTIIIPLPVAIVFIRTGIVKFGDNIGDISGIMFITLICGNAAKSWNFIPINYFIRKRISKKYGFNITRTTLTMLLSSCIYLYLILLLFNGDYLAGIMFLSPFVLSSTLAPWIVYRCKGEVFESRFDPNFVNHKAERLAQGL